LALWHEQLAYYSESQALSPEQQSFVKNVDVHLDEYFGLEF
jgi:hypothetical protein